MKTIIPYLLLIALALLCVFPFWWTLATALGTEGNPFAYPPTFWPRSPSLLSSSASPRRMPFPA